MVHTRHRAARLAGVCAGSLLVLVACSSTQSAGSVDASPEVDPTESSARRDAAAVELIDRIEHATTQWDDSCPRADGHGLCIEIAPASPSAERCEPPELGTVVVHPRDPAMARAAQAELAAVMERAGCASEVSCDREVLDVQPVDPEITRAFRLALATARLTRADADLETYFALTLPRDLGISGQEGARDSEHPGQATIAAMKGLESFYAAKMESGQRLVNDLTLIKEYEDRESILQAALRSSWAMLHMSDQLRSAWISEEIRDDDQLRAAYCDAMRTRAEAPRTIALDAALYCSRRAEQSGSKSETARECHDLLDRLQAPGS